MDPLDSCNSCSDACNSCGKELAVGCLLPLLGLLGGFLAVTMVEAATSSAILAGVVFIAIVAVTCLPGILRCLRRRARDEEKKNSKY